MGYPGDGAALAGDRTTDLGGFLLAGSGGSELFERIAAFGEHLPVRRLEEGRSFPRICGRRELDTAQENGAERCVGV